jgi:hypothetical protein
VRAKLAEKTLAIRHLVRLMENGRAQLIYLSNDPLDVVKDHLRPPTR